MSPVMAATDTSVDTRLAPDEAFLVAVADSAPENPFITPAYARARMQRDECPAAFLATLDSEPPLGCLGFVAEGRLHRDLHITSAPNAPIDHPIWTAIGALCEREGITRLRVQSFGSTGATIPALGRETFRGARREYVLELVGPTYPPLTLSSNHRRNLRRAERAGIVVEETNDPAAADTHAHLMDASMERRQERGEDVSAGTSPAAFRQFLSAGAATLFQARVHDEKVLSSILLLLSARGVYYHSAGTSPEGMKAGASQLLIATAIERLRDRGVTRFNLGGADDPESGLARFKLGFRPTTVELESAAFDMARGPRRVLIAAAESLRGGLRRWPRAHSGQQ